ncbi:hypothetical protein FQR65_LT01961 [Abscondita terminalis]|nr:hypothetical protein FQR65_LT01961 [Abscondita terminalis]
MKSSQVLMKIDRIWSINNKMKLLTTTCDIKGQPAYNNGIITTPPSIYQPDTRGAGYEIFKNLKKHHEKKFAIDGFTGEENTFGTALQKSIRVAMRMREHGVKPNDLILICAPNTIDSCIPIFASLYVGAKITCFDHEMHVNEAVILMNQIDPVMMFVSLESVEFIQNVMKQSNKTATLVVFGQSNPKYLNYFDMLQPCIDEESFLPMEVEGTQTAFIFFSSGTSGMPKGVCLSHSSYMAQCIVQQDINEPYETILMFSSLYWSTNAFYWLYSIMKGYCRICMSFSEDLQFIWRAIETYKPGFMFITPYRMRQLCNVKPSDVNLDNLKKIYVGGGPMFNSELKKYREMFSNTIVVSGYGMTEIGLICYFPSSTEEDLKFINEKPTSIGRVLNGVTYKVVDVDTEQTLGPNQKGELRVKSDGLLSEYYKLGSIDAFDEEGWFKTGDMVYFDEDFYFYYVERIKELIKYRGWHVPPKMIENVLMSREDVSAACVIGIPDEADDEHPMAIVILSNTSKPSDNIEKEMCRYVEDALGKSFTLKGGVKIVTEIPFTPTGKFDLRKLRNDIINAKKL